MQEWRKSLSFIIVLLIDVITLFRITDVSFDIFGLRDFAKQFDYPLKEEKGIARLNFHSYRSKEY